MGALGDFWLCKDGGHHFPLPRAAMSRVAGHHVLGHSPCPGVGRSFTRCRAQACSVKF